ncbi:28S ribosomal protein S28, mitochondrial [Trichoplax sp. H2]|nr:28S ribosomal protein S28, mitochondrial [Trichoplax sp. H2]|eukprot:RDD36777.1 28S ribosomal protein S28, mitochondrial [Trichoplax sp. H2]
MLRRYCTGNLMQLMRSSIGCRWFALSTSMKNSNDSSNNTLDNSSYKESFEMKDSNFENMLRHSKFIGIGKPGKKKVTGHIKHVVGDDLYVDFGGKFYGVVKRPSYAGDRGYKLGDSVTIRLRDTEVTGHFIGQSRHMTLCEADISLT